MEFAKYKSDILIKGNIFLSSIAETLIEQNLKLEVATEKEIKEKEEYQRFVGRLIYLSHTHPDITLQLLW